MDSRQRSEARDRLLAAASQLFYAEGINNVGVGRVVSSSEVTLATLYRHFPGKQDLVVAYLQGVHEVIAARADALAALTEGRGLIRALGGQVIEEIGSSGFRGCAFINAASEFEDPENPVRIAIAEHREWYFQFVRRAFADAGHERPGGAARHFVMLRDGAMTAGHLESPAVAHRTFNRGLEGLLK